MEQAKPATMSTDHTHHTSVVPKFTFRVAALVVVAGSMVLVGWAFDIAVLKSILPGWVSMKANTAVCFILIGVALLLTTRQSALSTPQSAILFSRLARFCVLLVGLIGLLTLGEYIFGLNPGIDQWLIREPVGMVGTSHPGRMAPETALNFVLLSVALWITGGLRLSSSIVRARWILLASASLSLAVASFALAALLSYLTPDLGAYGWFGLTLMAIHTAILFTMLGMAVIAMNWQPNILQWSINGRTTAMFACGIALLVFIGLNISRSQSWVIETSYRIAYSEEMVDGIGGIVLSITDAQAGVRGYVVTGDERLLKSFLSAKADSHKKMDALRHIAASNPYQRQQLTLIEIQANEALQWFQQGVEISRTGITAGARRDRIIHGEELIDRLQATFAQIENEHHQFVAQSKRQSESVGRFSYLAIFTSTFASLLIFLAVISRLNFAISERKQAEEQIRQLAFYDALTQLPNRRLLNDRLEQAMAASNRSGRYGALMFLDLDNFKPLNDTHGHDVGDLLLIEVARRITGCVREMDTCARFGGDEFVVILSELVTDKTESTTQARIVAEKIHAALAEPYRLKIQPEGKAETTVEHHCTSSIGIVLFVDHEASAEDILKWADMAMYQAKEAGRNLIRFYGANA